MAGVFAGCGHMHLAPDLLGLGKSKGVQPYLYNPGKIDQTIDFLRASQTVSKDLGRAWNSDLYITGFSQGGHASAVMHRALETVGNPSWHVRAGTGIAGPQEAARRGGHVEAVDVGPEDHTGTAFHAIPKIRCWFDDLSASSNTSP